MATSGSVTVKVTSFDNLVFTWTLTSQSIENNSSVVSWKMQLVAGSSGEIVSSVKKAWTVYVNGTKYSGTVSTAIGDNETKTLASGSTTIPHNDDGTKTFAFSFKQVFKGLVFAGVEVSDKSGSGNGTLPTIARASQPSCVTWPEHTQDVGDFGTTVSIHMNRKASTFTHTVRYAYGSLTGTIATGVETGTTWTIPLSFMELIPSSLSGSGTIYVDTYSGSTFVGTKSCGFTATVPASVKPTCSFTLEDVEGIDDIYGSPVQGLSRIKVTAKATQAYKSPIVSYTITANGMTYNEAEITTDVLKTAGTSKVTLTVKDQRGRSGSSSYDMSVKAYTAPITSKLVVHRCDADGSENDQGEYVKATFSAAITSLSSVNTATYVLRYKKTTATSWTTASTSGLNGVYTLTDRSVIFAADGNSSYDVEFTATDRHGSSVRTTSVSTAFTLINWGADGTSMAIGKVAEAANTLSIALSTEQIGNRYAASSPGVAGSNGYVLMAQVRVTAANADTPITFVFSRRQEMATMTVHLRLKNSTADSSTLETIRYEGINYGVFAYAPDPLTWNLYVLKGSNYDTITLQDWYTSKTMNSRVSVTFPGDLVDEVPQPYYRATPVILDSILDAIMPVGFVLTLYSHADPNTMYPGTTWERIQNAFLWATTSGGTIGHTGGASTHTLTEDELPAIDGTFAVPVVTNHATSGVTGHAYGANGGQPLWTPTSSRPGMNGTKTTSGAQYGYGYKFGGGKAHNNMPPYVQVSIWRRTA